MPLHCTYIYLNYYTLQDMIKGLCSGVSLLSIDINKTKLKPTEKAGNK